MEQYHNIAEPYCIHCSHHTVMMYNLRVEWRAASFKGTSCIYFGITAESFGSILWRLDVAQAMGKKKSWAKIWRKQTCKQLVSLALSQLTETPIKDLEKNISINIFWNRTWHWILCSLQFPAQVKRHNPNSLGISAMKTGGPNASTGRQQRQPRSELHSKNRLQQPC